MTDKKNGTLVILGTVVKTVGLRGEMKLLPGPDFWQDVLGSDGLLLVSPEGRDSSVTIERRRAKKNVWILKLAGIDSIDEAERHVGDELAVDTRMLEEAHRPRTLKPFQAIGLAVRFVSGAVAGRVIDILPGPAQDCLVVEGEAGRFLVPIVEEFVVRVDLDAGVVEIDPPEGLMEIGW